MFRTTVVAKTGVRVVLDRTSRRSLSAVYGSGSKLLARLGAFNNEPFILDPNSEKTRTGVVVGRPFSRATTTRTASLFSNRREFSNQSSSSSSSSPSLSTSSSTIQDHQTNNHLSELAYTNQCTPTSIANQYFDLSKIPSESERQQILHDFILLPDFLTPLEQDQMMIQATKKLKRALGKEIRYEKGHFDGVITGYRECSATEWGQPSSSLPSTVTNSSETKTRTPAEILQSIKTNFFPNHWQWVAPHILELEGGKGGIKPHVDHLEASGQVVAGICLGSTAVMELVHEDGQGREFRVLLPKGCFYFQRDSVRYHYKHGIPIDPKDHQFRGVVYPKEKRISVLLRNALEK